MCCIQFHGAYNQSLANRRIKRMNGVVSSVWPEHENAHAIHDFSGFFFYLKRMPTNETMIWMSVLATDSGIVPCLCSCQTFFRRVVAVCITAIVEYLIIYQTLAELAEVFVFFCVWFFLISNCKFPTSSFLAKLKREKNSKTTENCLTKKTARCTEPDELRGTRCMPVLKQFIIFFLLTTASA